MADRAETLSALTGQFFGERSAPVSVREIVTDDPFLAFVRADAAARAVDPAAPSLLSPDAGRRREAMARVEGRHADVVNADAAIRARLARAREAGEMAASDPVDLDLLDSEADLDFAELTADEVDAGGDV